MPQGEAGLSPESIEKVKNLESLLHIEVSVTPTCPYCQPLRSSRTNWLSRTIWFLQIWWKPPNSRALFSAMPYEGFQKL